jgi:hypothetical protein
VREADEKKKSSSNASDFPLFDADFCPRDALQ